MDTTTRSGDGKKYYQDMDRKTLSEDGHIDTIRIWTHGYYQDMDKKTLQVYQDMDTTILSGDGQKDTVRRWAKRYCQEMGKKTGRWTQRHYQEMDKRTLSGVGHNDTIRRWTKGHYQEKDTSLEQVFVLEVFCPLYDDWLLVLHPAVPFGPGVCHHGRRDGHLTVDINLHDDTLRNNNQSGTATQLLIKRWPFVIDADIRCSFQCDIYEHIFLQVKLN